MAFEFPSNRLWLLSCLIAYVALGGVLGIALYQRAHLPIFVEQPPRVGMLTDAPPHAVEGRIDPNAAQWYDLTRLPRISENLAHRIVAYRDAKIMEWQGAHPDKPAEQAPPIFTCPKDLLPIKGIGPKTVEQIGPFLRFDAATTQPRSTSKAD